MKKIIIISIIFVFQLQSYALELPAPVLLEPPDSTELTGSAIRLIWSPVPNAKRYNVVVLINNDTNMNTKDTYTNFTIRNPDKCRTYAWIVRAIDSMGKAGPWSEKRYLIPKKAPGVMQVYPEDNSEDYDYRDSLEWTKLPGKDTIDFNYYRIKIDKVKTLDSDELITLLTAGKSISCSTLESATKYYWQVLSINGGDTAFSEIFSFTTKNWSVPEPSILVSPENNSEINYNKITFKWNVPLGADSCILMLSQDLNYYYTLCKLKIEPLDNEISWLFNNILIPNTDFYWFVNTITDSETVKSEIWKFRTIDGYPSGIENITKNLSISPNPASDYIEISVGARRAVPDKVAIFDLLGIGQPTSPQSLTMLGEEKIKLDISGLSPGIYFVRVGDVVRKFVKL